ncbi:intracellular septation protein [bacterium MnTg02]|nr:intracellular septation protein [bacterium MnTg02]
MKQVLKLVLELGPLIIFFLANAQFGIFTATAVFMAAVLISLTASWLVLKKVATMPLITGVFVMVFGGLTIYLENETFIKVKPTIVNLLFAGILFGGLYYRRSFLKIVFEEAFSLTELGWRKLTVHWACFFVILAILNEIVWRSFSTDFWVSFKVFGLMPLTILFAVSQVGLLQKHELVNKEDPPGDRKSAAGQSE